MEELNTASLVPFPACLLTSPAPSPIPSLFPTLWVSEQPETRAVLSCEPVSLSPEKTEEHVALLRYAFRDLSLSSEPGRRFPGSIRQQVL